MFFLILLILLIILLIHFYIQRKVNLEKKLDKIKFQLNFPIIGAISYFISFKSFSEILENLFAAVQDVNETFALWFGPKLVIFAKSPEDIKTILTSPYSTQKDDVYEVLGKSSFKQSGLIYSNSNLWKKHRKYLDSAFNSQRVKSDISLLNDVMKDFVYELQSYCNGNDFNFHDIALQASIDATMRTQLNMKYNKIELKYLKNILKTMLKEIGNDVVEFFVLYPIYLIKSKFSYFDKVQKSKKLIYDNFLMKYEEKYEEFILNLSEEEKNDCSNMENFKKYSDNFIERMYRLYYHKLIEKEMIFDNLDVILLAGSDSTAITISNCILCLAIHQEFQEKLFNEIKKTINQLGYELNDNIDFDYDMIKQFNYVDLVVKESLRVLPTGIAIARKTTKDLKLEHGTVPQGTSIIIPLGGHHRAKYIWGSDALKFNPENFSKENFDKMHSCSYIPFSYGSRNCIAKPHAEIILRMMVIYLIRNYKFTTKLKMDQLKYHFKITTELVNGHIIQVEKR